MSDTPRKRDQSKNKGAVPATARAHSDNAFHDRFDKQAADVVQELALNGEAFNDLPYVRERIAAALRLANFEGTANGEAG